MDILVSAGEVSGDRMAAPVIELLARGLPGARFFGAGGEALATAGVELRHHLSSLAVTGLSEALLRTRGAAAMLLDLWWQVRRRRPRLGLLVDYPGINLRLAGMLRRAGIPVLYYGAPQRWAWLGFRAAGLARVVDCLAVTLPFEQEWFRRRGVAARFVGHPSLELFRAEPRARARTKLGLERAPVVALLPGSRANEVRQHLPLMRATLGLLPAGTRAVLVPAPGEAGQLCRSLAPDLPRAAAPVALGAADVALCASGSATVEAAMAGVPTVVCYRVSALTYEVARRLVQVPWLALPNLILGHQLLPELIQQQMTPCNMAREVTRLLLPREAARVRQGLQEVVRRLGPPGAAQRVAEMALELLLDETGWFKRLKKFEGSKTGQ